MSELQDKIGAWQIATFGTKQTIVGMKNHLKRELAEYLSAKNFESEIEESADLVILLMGIAQRQGYDLLTEVERKFEEVLLHRQWGEPDSDGVISHLENNK